jgi:hypothetical protein
MNPVINVFAQEKGIVKKSIKGEVCEIIPSNSQKTILVLGGINTKDEKLVWYKEMCKENISNINLSIIVELFELPSFIPQKMVENKIKKWCMNLEFNHQINSNVFYEWTKEISDFYHSNVGQVTLIIVDIDNSYTKIEGAYSTEKMKKLIFQLNKSK